jgi:quinate/shikimate dehydrogenase (NAD+)
MSVDNGGGATAGVMKVGLIGAGIQASRSPAMHMEEARALGIRVQYELLDLDTLGGAAALGGLLRRLEDDAFAGVNVTHPCKQSVLAHLQELSPEASFIEAVNTVVFGQGRRLGFNTDWIGFAESLRRRLADAALGHVTQLGAGGAGCATVYALLTCGAGRVYVCDTDAARAEGLANRFAKQFGPGRVVATRDLTGSLAHSDGLVNASPVGMRSHPGMPLPRHLLRPDLWVVDIVYFPLETELLRAARSLGCRALDGGTMAVLQAAAAFKLFTGVEPEAERMLARFYRPLSDAATG